MPGGFNGYKALSACLGISQILAFASVSPREDNKEYDNYYGN